MIQTLLNLIPSLLKAFGALFMYKAGADAQSNKQLKKDIKRKEEEDDISEDVIRKSDSAILAELRKHYSRDEDR